MEFNKKTTRSIMLLISFTVLLYLGVSNIGLIPQYISALLDLLKPIIIALFLAFALNAILRRVEGRLFGRPWKRFNRFRVKAARPLSILLTLLLALGVIAGVLFLIIPELVSTISLFAARIPSFFAGLELSIRDLSKEIPQLEDMLSRFNINFSNLGNTAFTWVQSLGNSLLEKTVNFSLSLVSYVTNTVLGLILAIYILAQKEKLGRQTRSLLYAIFKEAHVDRFLELAALANNTFSSFITGQLLEALILGCIFLLLMNFFAFPYALLISVLIMVCAMIPMVGAFIACAVGFLLILTNSTSQALWFVLFFVIVQQLEGNLIYPRVVGKSVGLSPIWVLSAITIGGALWGILGMLVSIPLVSVAYTLVAALVKSRLDERRIPHYKTD